jgi:hypothetical protein
MQRDPNTFWNPYLAGVALGLVLAATYLVMGSGLGASGGSLRMGIAAKITRGCASGQALSGGALLSVGAWVFFLAFFGGGYALAYFVRREWR